MAQVSGIRTSYSGASYSVNPLVPQKRAIADFIDMIDPRDVPLLKYLGISDKGAGGVNKASKFRLLNWPQTQYQWLNDTLAPLTTLLSADATVATATAAATQTVLMYDATSIRTGDVIHIDGELIHINSFVPSTKTATWSRFYGGTNHTGSNVLATDAAVEIISRARVEGADSDTDYTTQVADEYNYTQIFQAEIKVSRSQNKLDQLGMSSEYDYQVRKKFQEQLRLLEKTLFRGYRNAGSATLARSMGGFKQFITDNTASLASAPLTQKDLEDKIQACWEDGGMPDLIICNAWAKRKISSFYAGSVRTTRTENTGGVVIDNIETEFGTLGMLMSRWCPSTEIFIVTSEYLGVLPFDAFFDEPLAKDGDYEKGQIVGEYGFVVKNDKAHAMLTTISTTS